MRHDTVNDVPRHRAKSHHLIKEREHDPYKSQVKPTQPAVCRECGAVFSQGRWAWHSEAREGLEARILCPACQRIRDRVPGGVLTLDGRFYREHQEEILALVANIEAREKQAHPLKRIMTITQQQDGAVITFTDPQLGHAFIEGIHKAYGGTKAYRYCDEETFLRAFWSR